MTMRSTAYSAYFNLIPSQFKRFLSVLLVLWISLLIFSPSTYMQIYLFQSHGAGEGVFKTLGVSGVVTF